MKKMLSMVIALCFLCGFNYAPYKKPNVHKKSYNKRSYHRARPANSKQQPGDVRTLRCHAGVVIDQNSGRILFSKNGNTTMPMASTTKIITAIVAIEQGNLKDTVTISKKSAVIKGSTVGYKSDERVKLEELLYGLMLKSGNDAAIAIAEHIGGSVENFAKLMNNKAIEIGAFNTSFVTPHGLDAENHFTTAEDLAKITAYALNNETFARISATKNISSGVSGNFNRSYSNINKFLYKLDNADGVKTGYTGGAGKCLVASVKHENGRYISVVFNSNDRWNDAEKMIKYAENNYKFIKIYNSGKLNKRLRVYGGKSRYITGKINKDLYLPVLKNDSETVKVEEYVPSALFSPVNENELIGNLAVIINDKIVAKYPIVSSSEVKRKNEAG